MAEFKFFCPQCDRQIQCDTGYAGTQINCPACKQGIVVPQMPVPAQARTGRYIFGIATVLIVLAALVAAGWFGYSEIKIHKLPPGLVASWSGEGKGTDPVGGNNGVLHGDVSIEPGKVGQAFALDGPGAYVEVPSSPEITPKGPFSVVAWVNYLRTSGSSSSVPIVAKGRDAPGPVDWFLGISPGRKLRPHAHVGGQWVYFDCASTLATGRWYHVAMVYDGTSLRGYVNGKLDGTKAVSGALRTTDNSLKIGAYAPVNGGPVDGFCLPGKIDEVSLFNRALSASEIKAIYSQQK